MHRNRKNRAISLHSGGGDEGLATCGQGVLKSFSLRGVAAIRAGVALHFDTKVVTAAPLKLNSPFLIS